MSSQPWKHFRNERSCTVGPIHGPSPPTTNVTTSFSGPNWSELPYPFLLDIARCLPDDRDRRNMAMVCKNWRQAAQNPSLWREKDFIIGGPISEASGLRACKFAKMHGAHLRRLNLSCVYHPWHGSENISRPLKRFLNLVKRARLDSLTVDCCGLEGRWNCSSYRGKLATWFGDFLSSQSSIKVFVMLHSMFELDKGVHLLERLASAAALTLRCLFLMAFIRCSSNACVARPFIDATKTFQNLRMVHISYSYINEEILQAWAMSSVLVDLHLLVHLWDAHDHVITNDAWREMKASSPHLKVQYSIMEVSESETVIPLLPPALPLSRLLIKQSSRTCVLDLLGQKPPLWREQQMVSILHRLTTFHSGRLQDLEISLENIQQESLDEALISLLEACGGLAHLSVTACVGDRAQRTIHRCQEQAEQRRSNIL